MITVLQLVHKYRGNYELFNLQADLDRQRFRMLICYLADAPDGCNRMEDVADKVFYLQRRPETLRWYNLPLIFTLKKIIDDEHVQVVNCQQHRTTPLGILAGLFSKTRPALISTLHGLGMARTWQRRLSNWLLYRYLYRIVGISSEVSRDIVATNWGLGQDKVVTIQNGLDYTPYLNDFNQYGLKEMILPGRQKYFWFGTAGRLSKVKNQATLIEAFALLASRLPDCILVIAGQGELELSLKEKALSLGLDERIYFLGFRKDMPQFLQALDVFVLPSWREGFGLALVEAMASARPIIAAQVGGIPEVVGSGAFGRMVDPHDVEGLAAAMVEFAELPASTRHELGRQARHRVVQEFSAERMVACYEALYVGAYKAWSLRS